MYLWQNIIVILFAVYSLGGFFLGFRKTYYKKNPFGLTPFLNFLGAFVWADGVVFGLFFFLTSLFAIVVQNFLLFCLVYSVFWVIRSLGEQSYWFHEQFTLHHKNPPHTLKMSKFYPGESIWVHYQIFWQCISVISIISSVYFFVQLFK